MQFRQLMLAASALLMAGASPALGQGSSPPVAGDSILQSLVAEALARNPTVAQRQAAVRAATLRIRPAGSLPDPMLTVGVMDLVLPHFDFNQSDFTEADVELSQEIPWPGTLGARSGVMRAAADGARAEEGTVRRDLTTTMAVAYYRLGYKVTALESLRHQRELLEGAVQLSTTRYATGAAPQSDPLQAKLARDRLRSEEFALESERLAALAAVNALRNRAPGDSVLGTPIDPAASYQVTTNDFLANGGDGFTNLTLGTGRTTAPGFDVDALVGYLGAGAPVAPGPANRITKAG